jgi:hypothetical protein
MKIKKVRIVFKQNREAKSTLLQLLNNIKKSWKWKILFGKTSQTTHVHKIFHPIL